MLMKSTDAMSGVYSLPMKAKGTLPRIGLSVSRKYQY